MKSIYKTPQAKAALLGLYDEKLNSLNIDYEEIDVNTTFGRTRVIKTGFGKGKKIVLFHGINAGSPLTLESVKDLHKDYSLYAIDTIGQATKSEENPLNIKDNSYAMWADEVLDQLGITEANFIGISYGAYILQKLITHRPSKVAKCIFVVPSGLVNGKLGESTTRLTIPLIKYHITKKDSHLKEFIKAFVPENDEFMFRMQKALLSGFKMDYRRPTLVKGKDVKNFTNPVYIIVADDDVFFPGDAAINRAKDIFKNIQGTHVLKNSKHMPSFDKFSEIQQKIKSWIEE
jgi:pimeloyl-ACP methyl ester carboxylesterase